MQLRPYQTTFVNKSVSALETNRRVLGVAPTGSGKTVMAASLFEKFPFKRALFLADAQELIKQAAGTFQRSGLAEVEVDMAEQSASGNARIVVGTTQSVSRRLDKWDECGGFDLICTDEAHRNTLGDQAQSVLTHWPEAKVLGITATPFRSDRKELGDFYEVVSHEIKLLELINEGWLSSITLRSVKVPVSMASVRTSQGDYSLSDLENATMPHMAALAQMVKEQFAGRKKAVAFLPTVATSQAFTQACKEQGIKAAHVSGDDKSALNSDWDLISNCALLTTGWDCPPIDTVFMLRPTKSQVLFSQMVGRGTRIYEGKTECLVIDPFYSDARKGLVRGARLIASSSQEAEDMQRFIDDVTLKGTGRSVDIRDAQTNAVQAAHERLAEALKKSRKSRDVSIADIADMLGDPDCFEYEADSKTSENSLSTETKTFFERHHLPIDMVKCEGHARQIMAGLRARMSQGLATPRQVKFLLKRGLDRAMVMKMSFEDAGRAITSQLARMSHFRRK